LREFFAELNPALAGDGELLSVARRYCDPDIQSDLGVIEGTLRGVDAFATYLAGQLAVVAGMQIDPEDYIEVGEHVVMPFHLHGTARETGLELSFHYVQLFTMRDGKIRRSRMYRSVDKALAVARSS
jgi:ketosteroid isomerase-like protein